MTDLNFVCWKWPPPAGYRSKFGPDTVNVLRRMVARHYDRPHGFFCVTDEKKGLDPEVQVVPAWNDYKDLQSPSGGRNPACYRRLRAFHPEIGATFGPRFVSLDLDVVITANLTPLLDRPDDFVIYGDTNPRTYYNGSFLMMNAGARPQVWTTFHPVKSPQRAKAAGHHGSDQGWISFCLGPDEPKWTDKDGIYSFRNHIEKNGRKLPDDAKMVVFHGPTDPWSDAGRALPFVREHYR